MDSNNRFQIIESLGLIVVIHKKLLIKDGIGYIIKNVLQNPYFNSDYLVLIDIRDAEIKMTADEIEETSNFVYENLDNSGIKKFAILITTAQTNKAVKYVRFYKNSSKYQVFTTLEAALYWLKIPISGKKQIKTRLSNLSKTF